MDNVVARETKDSTIAANSEGSPSHYLSHVQCTNADAHVMVSNRDAQAPLAYAC